MSDAPAGPGWWQANDGKWYPPTQQPGPLPPPPTPAMPPPGYGTAYGYQASTTVPRTNGFAVASLVLGLLWIWFIGSILALIFGYKAKREIDASGGTQTGRGMAVAGIVLGWVGTAGAILFIVALSVLGDSATTSFEDVGNEIGGVNSDPVDGHCNQDRWLQDPDC